VLFGLLQLLVSFCQFARIHLIMHVYTCIILFMHDTAERSAIQDLSQKRSVRAVVFDYGNVLCLEQTLEDMKGMALVCGIPHERFSDLYWKLRPPYDRGDIDGPAYWTAVAGQQELGLRRDQIATLIKLDSESITRPNQGAVQWAKLLHHEGFPLTLLSNMPLELSRHVTKSFPSLSTFEYLIYSCDYRSIKPELAIYRNCLELLKAAPQDILYLDDRAENLEAAARLGINSVLFDTVEKTASRVESRFDIPVPSYGRREVSLPGSRLLGRNSSVLWDSGRIVANPGGPSQGPPLNSRPHRVSRESRAELSPHEAASPHSHVLFLVRRSESNRS